MIQYGKQTIEECDIEAVVKVLRENEYLTTGPRVAKFENQVCQLVGAKHGVAVNSGTAALHCAIYAIDLQPGDEVIVPTISFAATANCVVYQGGIPVFCEVQEDTMNLDPTKLEELITERTKAIIVVDFAGQTPDYHALQKICQKHSLPLIEDAAHTIGLKVSSCPHQPYVGNCADLTTFSFHPVKNMTTAEGGMIMTNNDEYASRMYRFRNHGISVDYHHRRLYEYDIADLGYNYRLTDLQCALGISQLKRVESWIQRRNQIANIYQQAFAPYKHLLKPLANLTDCAYHIFVIQLNLENLDCDRDQIFREFKENGIGVNVHYLPIYQLSFYQNHPQIKSNPESFPVTEKVTSRILTIPLFPTITDDQIQTVIDTTISLLQKHQASP